MNSIIVLLLLSASVASAQSATSKAAPKTITYKEYAAMSVHQQKNFAQIADRVVIMGSHLAYDVPSGINAFFACSDINMWGAHGDSFVGENEKQTGSVKIGDETFPCDPIDASTTKTHIGNIDPGKSVSITVPLNSLLVAKPKPSVKKKAAPECLGGGCDPGINPPSESSFIHCPETGCPTDLPESIHVIVDPKPQEEPKKDSLTGFGTNTPIVFKAAPSEAKGDAIQLKDDPSKLCDALSPTEKISCLMNIVAPTAPEATSPMPVYVREPVTQVVAHCPEGWHVEVWRPAYNPNVGIYGLPLFSGWEAGYVADNRPMKITMTIDKEHPDRCAVDVK